MARTVRLAAHLPPVLYVLNPRNFTLAGPGGPAVAQVVVNRHTGLPSCLVLTADGAFDGQFTALTVPCVLFHHTAGDQFAHAA